MVVAPQEEGNTPLVAEQPRSGCAAWLHKSLLRELPPHLQAAYGWFGLCLILIIGSQAFIFPVRTTLFYDIIENKYGGRDKAAPYDAFAKSILPLIQLPVVIGFNVFWAANKSPRLLIGLVCAIFCALYIPVYIGLVTGVSADIKIHAYTHNEIWLSYLMYYTTELKAVVCPVMIWCVLNDLTPPKLAKIAYPPIVFTIQLGSLIGSFMAGQVEWFGGSQGLVLIQIFALIFAIFAGLRGVSKHQSGDMPDEFLDRPVADTENTNAPAAIQDKETCGQAVLSGVQGLWLIATHPYLMCTCWVSVAHLVPRLFLDFQGTQVVKNYCNVHQYDNYDNCKTSFFGWVSFVQTCGSLFISLVGTRKIVEYGGLRLGLAVLPVMALVTVLATALTTSSLGTPGSHGLQLPNLWITQISIILMNTIGYGLNGPSREQLYAKTSRDMKYKAKSWSDMYGNSSMKSLASVINLQFNAGQLNVPVTSGITVGWVSVWLCIVHWVGTSHKSLMGNGKIIGIEGEGQWACIKKGDDTQTANITHPIGEG